MEPSGKVRSNHLQGLRILALFAVLVVSLTFTAAASADVSFTKAYGWGVVDGMSQFETCTSTCGSGIAGGSAGELDYPWGVATDSSGDVYVADSADERIEEFSAGAPSTTSTSLSGGGQSGASISVPENTAVSDTATLSGTNASTATGTVTYSVYSDSGCTTAVSSGRAQGITTPGTLPASSPATLSTPGTYYWQASYSVGHVTKQKSSTVPNGRVISSSPKAASKHKASTKIALTVSRGKH
jgi:hypothetical protein